MILIAFQVQRPLFDWLQHRASTFISVAAVGKSTLHSKIMDTIKVVIHPIG